MKLICHIGTPKTASTLLQNSCAANPDWLARHGVAYGEALSNDPNHITLFFAAARGIHDLTRAYGINTVEELDAFRERLVATIAGHRASLPAGIDRVILSSENLTGNLRSTEGIAQLRQMLVPHFDAVEIVLYVRRQDDAILSMYGEYMRRGFSPATFDKFSVNCMSETSPAPYLFYRRELLKWIEVWGREAITVRLFDSDAFIGGQILTDFMAVVLGRTDFDMSDFIPSPAENRGLSAPVLEALRRLQPAFPFVKGHIPNRTRQRMMPLINALPTTPRPVMSAARSRQIMSFFEAPNAWLRDTFFPGRDGPLFPPKEGLPETGNLGLLSDKEFAEIGSLLIDPLFEDI